ncbi:hypothetical protein CRENBAI_011185 [Crenichthys baileyi]|uniref:Uncharacterized protein n=1 Tax=Crenichthys baileyi TaxID=28760 RepID=A0AAV9S0U9_9TELE
MLGHCGFDACLVGRLLTRTSDRTSSHCSLAAELVDPQGCITWSSYTEHWLVSAWILLLWGFPGRSERHRPSSVSWAVPWASSRWDVPGTPLDCAVNVHKSCKSLLGECTSTKNKLESCQPHLVSPRLAPANQWFAQGVGNRTSRERIDENRRNRIC